MRGGLFPLLLLVLFSLFLSVTSERPAWEYGTNWYDNPYLDRNPPQQSSPVGDMGCLDKEKDFFSISPRRFHILLSCHTSYYIGLMAGLFFSSCFQQSFIDIHSAIHSFFLLVFFLLSNSFFPFCPFPYSYQVCLDEHTKYLSSENMGARGKT